MIHKHCIKALLIIGMAVMAALGLSLTLGPVQAWALDSDKDGLEDNLEARGFDLSPNLVLWEDGSNHVNGTDGCQDPTACLSQDRVDMFVIVRLDPNTLVDPSRMEEYFAFAVRPVSDQGLGWNKVWVLREISPTIPANRQITFESPQLAPLLVEDKNPNQIAQGLAQYGSIMIPDKGVASFYSQKTVNDIDDACANDPLCQDAFSGALYYDDLVFRHFQWLLIHESLHVLFELDNSLRNIEGHHITRGDYVMKPAVVVTEKKGKVTYYIPDAFSSTERENFKFYE